MKIVCTVVTLAPGVVRVGFKAVVDRDDGNVVERGTRCVEGLFRSVAVNAGE